jgi:hypothetical protein
MLHLKPTIDGSPSAVDAQKFHDIFEGSHRAVPELRVSNHQKGAPRVENPPAINQKPSRVRTSIRFNKYQEKPLWQRDSINLVTFSTDGL